MVTNSIRYWIIDTIFPQTSRYVHRSDILFVEIVFRQKAQLFDKTRFPYLLVQRVVVIGSHLTVLHLFRFQLSWFRPTLPSSDQSMPWCPSMLSDPLALARELGNCTFLQDVFYHRICTYWCIDLFSCAAARVPNKLTYLLIKKTAQNNWQWLKCNGTQGNAVPPPPLYGLKRSPTWPPQIVIMLEKGTRPLWWVGRSLQCGAFVTFSS